MITILQEKRGDNDVFILSDGKNILAECVYSFKNSEILDVTGFNECADIFLEDVLRASLSKLDFAGKTTVISKNAKLGDFLTKLGFTYSDGIYSVDTGSFFKPCGA